MSRPIMPHQSSATGVLPAEFRRIGAASHRRAVFDAARAIAETLEPVR